MVEGVRAEGRIYGLNLASSVDLSHQLEPACGPPDIAVDVAGGPPEMPGDPAGEAPCWESPERASDGRPVTRLTRRGPWWALDFHAVGTFFVGDRRIVAVPEAGAPPELLELRLLGPVLSFWLELRGIVCLHASAVVADGRAVVFLAHHGGGKSSLAATLVEQGLPLLTDDVLPLETLPDGSLRARPGYPQMRFWPAEAERFAGAAEELPRVLSSLDKRRVAVGPHGFGAFHGEPCPLAAVFLVERRDDAVGAEIEPVLPSQAVVALLAGSFLPRLAAGAGLQERRLDLLARLVEAVPVRRLVFPRGSGPVEPVVARVLAAVRASRHSR